MNICLYGASSNNIDPSFFKPVEALGAEMAGRGHRMIFGGGAMGLMGAAARGMSSQNGEIIGIAPTFFDKPGILYDKCTDFIFTQTMRERKELMEKSSDAFLVVPGGIGTFEEFFEILTLKQLNQLNKPIAIFNVNGYYDALLHLLDSTIEKGFMKESCRSIYAAFDGITAISDMLDAIEKEHALPLDLTGLKNI